MIWSSLILCCNDRTFALVNRAKYLGVISDRGIVWRIHIAVIEVVAFCIFIKSLLCIQK
jgi:hypothetical protein